MSRPTADDTQTDSVDGRVTARWLSAFGAAGVLSLLVLYAARLLSLPLQQVGSWDSLQGIAVVPMALSPVAFRFDVVVSLSVPWLLAATVLWLLSVCGVALASGVAWAGDDGVRSLAAHPGRFVDLCLFAIVTGFVVWVARYAVTGTRLSGDHRMTVGVVTVAAAGICGPLLAAPVAVVRDGRTPAGAVRWALDGLDAVTALAGVALLGGLWLLRVLSLVIGSEVGLPIAVTVAVGTAVFAGGHTVVAAGLYVRTASD